MTARKQTYLKGKKREGEGERWRETLGISVLN